MTASLIGGRYELLERLGAGGMGEVYRCSDRLTGETVALKRAFQRPVRRADASPGSPALSDSVAETITSATSQDSAVKAQTAQLALSSEFRILTSLRHPNIISVLDYGFQANGFPFFTMELLSDSVPIDQAARGQSLDVQLDVLFQMLQALSYLHRHGIVHRDLKSSNVLVKDRQVTVLDFGVAGLPEDAVAGTVGFIAPEVLGGAPPTPTSDFYAVGGIAYEILTASSWRRSLSQSGRWPDMGPLEGLGAIGEFVKTLLSADPTKRRYSDASSPWLKSD